jgi:TPR repeat protein
LKAGLALAGIVLLASPVQSQVAPNVAALRGRADDGDVDAQNQLGSLYSNGVGGLKPDYAEALRWFRAAADKGFAPAQYNLALAYEAGRGVPADERQAFKYFLMAAEQGYAPAQFNAGNMYAQGRGVGQDYFEANLWFKQAADGGLAEAQYNLGLAYELAHGMKKDDGQAVRWYKQAAEKGYPPAQHNLGLMAEDGRGMAKDPVAAANYYRAAAEQGFAQAQVNYGLLLSEGRPGVPKDGVQALVWLSRAVQNGARPDARDLVASRLTPDQVAAANQILSGGGTQPATVANAPVPAAATVPSADSGNLVSQLRDQSRRLAGQVESLTADKEAAERQVAILAAQVKDMQQEFAKARTGASAAPAPAVDVARYETQLAALNSRLEQATAALKQAQDKNAQLEAGQKLAQEKAAADANNPSAPASGNQAAILSNLQRDNARLNDEVKRATRELLSLNSQLRTLQRDAAKSSNPPVSKDGSTDQVAELTAKAQQAGAEAERLAAENRRLAGRVAEFEQVPARTGNDKSLAQAQKAAADLKQQLEALQAEKAELEKWSKSIETNLNQQTAAAKLAEGKTADFQKKLGQLQAQLADRDEALDTQKQAAVRAQRENKDLGERLAKTEAQLKSAGSRKADAAEIERLQQQLADSRTKAAQAERQSLELTEQVAAAIRDGKAAQARLDQVTRELEAVRGAAPRESDESIRLKAEVANLGQKNDQLAAAVADLTKARDDLQGKLSAAQGGTAEAAGLQASLAQARAQVSDLQRDLAAARQQAGGASAGTETLKQQLAEANQALDKSGLTVAELTAANDKLERELAAARQGATNSSAQRDELARARRDLVELATLREENIRLRKDAAAGDQLVRGNEQLTDALGTARRELDKAQAHAADLEKQLADALTVRTSGGDPARKAQADLAEANRTIEKLTATVADLTAANDKLEKDVDNAQKSAAAALAAQSQAVSAASPDAFQMEISTLNARVKQLEGQVEEERTNAAKEITTLAGQLQRTRETNKSLTDANRALLSAKESDTSATKDDLEQLQAKARDLAAANDLLRRQGQQQAESLRSVTAERDSLQSQLVDARKVATVLPGLSDEKAALQEKLEAVGTQLAQLQKEQDDLQKTNADLIQQLAASRQAAEKAQADMAAIQGKAAEAEKAAESHNASVAELTAANDKLEREREDMRRLVDSYRADISRLTQSVRNAEQQRTEAERGGQQNIDALTAQMTQLRRDLEAARTAQARLNENFAAQDRDRVATITQLRTENGALAARLNQAQGTLDQIASAARLGTPAATIASGGPAPVVRPATAPTVATPEVRYHTVTDGDSLSRISLRYYGTANRWQDIFNANRDVLQGSNSLRVGQQLRIP